MIPLAWWWLGCGSAPPAPVELQVALEGQGVELRADRPVHEVVVRDGHREVVRRRLEVPSDQVYLPVRPPPGARWEVVADGVQVGLEAPPDPVGIWLEAPRGQGRRPLERGDDTVHAVAFGPGGQAALGLQAHLAPQVVEVVWGDRVERVRLDVVGQVVVLEGPLAPAELVVGDRTFHLEVQTLSPDEARSRIEVVGSRFPTDRHGATLATLPADTLVLPPDALYRLQQGLGTARARAEQAPWAWQAVDLLNHGDEALVVMVEARVVGEGAEAFAPRLRDATGLERVVVTARLPPGETTSLALPLYVDRGALVGRSWTRRIRVTPFGAATPLHEVDAPLVLRRASAVTWIGLALSVGAAALGWGWMGLAGRRWLERQPTADLVTVSLFGSLSYVIAGTLQVVGYGVAAVLGPFAPFLTAIADDALRACLLGTLLTLLPRPGIAALATVIGALLRALTLGSLHPADLLYVGTTVVWIELFAWIAGLTRSGAWRDEGPTARWVRLSLGLGLANVAGMATGLVVSAALYRLYYAGWYVALLLVWPGFLYVVVGCRVAVPLASSLRRVAS